MEIKFAISFTRNRNVRPAGGKTAKQPWAVMKSQSISVLWFIWLFVYVTICSARTAADQGPYRIKEFPNVCVTLRIDDMQSRITTYGQSWSKFLQTAERHGAKLTLAVVPHRLIEPQNDDGRLVEQLNGAIARGHCVIMHGYNHICPLCLSSGHEFCCNTSARRLSIKERIEYLKLGITIFEQKLGRRPLFYCGPGSDDEIASPNYDAVTAAGFRFITQGDNHYPYRRREVIEVPCSDEFTWGLTTATYQKALDEAKTRFLNLAKRYPGYFGLCFHDPFIRDGYENGLLAQWLDEFLTFIDTETAGNVWYATNEEAAVYYFNLPSLNYNNTIR
ncbi:MAG: DUF2334 domain-containing protein [bacterium]|nr:DUF2334 domain-containing protein [bacterium]